MGTGARYGEEQREYIRDLRKKGYSGVDSAAEFEKRFGMSINPRTIISIWKRYGFEAIHGGQRTGLRDQGFLGLYYFAFGDADLISGQSGLKLETIVKKCKEFGLDFVKKRRERRRVNYDYDFPPHPDFIQAGANKIREFLSLQIKLLHSKFSHFRVA